MKNKPAAKIIAVIAAAATTAFSAAAIPASARYNNSSQMQIEAFTTAYQTYWVNTEQQKFPGGAFWNSQNNPDGYTYTLCQYHPGTSCGKVYWGQNFLSGSQFYLRSATGDQYMHQCAGFARKLAQDFYGIPSANGGVWLKINLSEGNVSLRVGDQLRINDQHTIFITHISGNTVTFADCNGIGPCVIRWNGTATVNPGTCELTMDGSTYTMSYVFRPGMAGDVNGDSYVTSLDRDAILYMSYNHYPYTNNEVNRDYAYEAADLNNDGRITMDDWNIANAQLNYPILTNQRFLTTCGLSNYSYNNYLYF